MNKIKRIILYFTGTGNSLAVARTVAEKLGECEVRSIAEVVRSGEMVEADEIGIITPVYMYRAPRIVLKVLRQISGTNYLFAIATNGQDMGNVFRQIGSHAKRCGLTLQLGVSLIMPDNYLPFFGAPESDAQSKIFRRADERLSRAVIDIINHRQLIDDTTPFFVRNVVPGLFYWSGYLLLSQLDRGFSVSAGCSGCSICKRVCPVDNIEMKENGPKWLHQCEQCYACIQWCPSNSIEFSFFTRNKKRYQHPQITLKDMLNQAGE